MYRQKDEYLTWRKHTMILRWIYLIGIITLLISLVFGGLILFFTEIGFICNLYYWIDEYNIRISQNLFDDDHRIRDISKFKKILLLSTTFLFIITTIILLILSLQGFSQFLYGIGMISNIYFSNRAVEKMLAITEKKNFESFHQYIKFCGIWTLILTLFSIILLCINYVLFFIFLIIVGIINVIENDILAEIIKRENDI